MIYWQIGPLYSLAADIRREMSALYGLLLLFYVFVFSISGDPGILKRRVHAVIISKHCIVPRNSCYGCRCHVI